MRARAIFERIRQTLDERAYFTPAASVSERERDAMAEIEVAIQSDGFDPEDVRTLIRAAHADKRIDRVMMLSALHVVACHPRVSDWELAARLAGAQEYAALELGGPRMAENLASVDRHRGVLAFLRGHYEVALDYFTRAFERQRTAENLGNILSTMLRLGEEEEAWELLGQIRRTFPSTLVDTLNHAIQNDPDLALLRSEVIV